MKPIRVVEGIAVNLAQEGTDEVRERDDPSDTSPTTAKHQIRERDDPSDRSPTTAKRQIRERDDLFGTEVDFEEWIVSKTIPGKGHVGPRGTGCFT